MESYHQESDPFATKRHVMVKRQLRARGIADEDLLAVMGRVARHLFIPFSPGEEAYADHPLPIGEGQTISQPYIVALMTEALCVTGKAKVLEIGTGSGYQTAILAELANTVFTVERSSTLSSGAQRLLRHLGYENIQFVVGDGTLGLPAQAPFDRIIATGSLPCLPQGLLDQLTPDGICVLPVGDRSLQRLLQVKKVGSSLKQHDLGACCFVPLIGKEGWSS